MTYKVQVVASLPNAFYTWKKEKKKEARRWSVSRDSINQWDMKNERVAAAKVAVCLQLVL